MVKTISGLTPVLPDYILDNKIEFGETIKVEENIENIKIDYDKILAGKIYSCFF